MRKRFSKNAETVLTATRALSKTKNLSQVDVRFLIKSIIKQKGCLGKMILETMLPKKELSAFLIKKTNADDTQVSALDITNKAIKTAFISKSSFIGTEYLAGEILTIPELSKKVLTPVMKTSKGKKGPLSDDKIDVPDSNNEFFGELNSIIENFFNPNDPQNRKRNFSSTEFCSDLTSDPQENHVLVGRDYELERISHVLGRKMKNNPVLIGDPGVGKTAIVEGLAKKIYEGKSEHYLFGKKILSLDLGLLIAGTTFRGEFEARLKEVVAQAKKDPNIILFIDEIHNLIGAGNATGGMDAANLLKPILSRGEIQLIGATTIDEYRKHIEKDAALERRLQPIMVEEPSVDETIEILAGIQESYEDFHNVSILEEANSSAAVLAKRYLTDRNLPDSAIDLIDETAARLRSGATDGVLYQKIKKLEDKLERIVIEKEHLVITDKYEEAIRIRKEEQKVRVLLGKVKKELEKQEDSLSVIVDAKEIKTTLANIAQIPQEVLTQDNKNLVRRVRTELNENLIGQNKVKKQVLNTILRQASGISNPNRPLGSFLFVGPSGVGKTHCAKLLANAISPLSKNALIQINMSEFMEKHSISRLLGAPAGYVGYEESGEFADKIRRNPHSVILFDEIEKADPSILSILLQILEEGEITNAKGRKINFRNTIVILTSNLGIDELNKVSKLGFEEDRKAAKPVYEETVEAVVSQIEELLLPETTDRLDHILVFDTLTKKELKKIALHEIADLKERLSEKEIELDFDESIIDLLLHKIKIAQFGARKIRKQLQEKIEPLIAQKILSNKNIAKISLVNENKKITVSVTKKK